jgi:DNA-binding MarR family transcriptional regulator
MIAPMTAASATPPPSRPTTAPPAAPPPSPASPPPPASGPASIGLGLDRTPPSVDSSPPFQSVGFSLSTLGYEVARGFRQTLDPLGIEPRDFGLLRAVAADEGRSQQVIGERLGIAPSRMVAFVDLLESRGLLERRLNADDRRTRALHLTASGRDLLDRAFAAALAYERSLCDGLSPADRAHLLELLSRVGLRLGLKPGVHAAHTHGALSDDTVGGAACP